ncbi:transporter [bacterium]|nr:transporter [bacterium]
MKRTGCATVAVIASLAGCASPPQSDPRYAATEQHIHQVVAHEVSHVPELIQTDAEIEGEHPLGFYVQFALGRNPEILAAQRAIAASSEVIPQVTAYDDPMLVDTFQPISSNSLQTAAGRAPNTLMLSQKFPWFGKLETRGQIAEQDVQIAMTRLAQAELKVTEDVRLAYYEMQFSQRAIAITEEDASLLRDLLQIAEARYRTGAASQQDVLRAQVELNKLDDRLIALRRQLQQSQADLAKVLHVSPESKLLASSDIGIPSAPEQIDQLYQMAAECRPELQERFYAIQKTNRARDLAELNYYPDVTAGIGWQAVTTGGAVSPVSNGRDNVAFTLGINLPIWCDKLDAGVREWEQRSLENSRRYEATLDDTFRLIRRLMVQVDAIQQQLDLFQNSMIPKTEQALRVSTADYRVNKVDFQQLLDNWSDLLMFHLQVARLESSLAQTLASLERVVGCELASPPAPLPLPKDAADTAVPAAEQPAVLPPPAPEGK